MMKTVTLMIFLAVAFVGGCATDGSAPQTGTSAPLLDDRATAERLVKSLFVSYQKFSLNAFSDKVADDFVPIRSEFINAAAQNARQGDILDINFSLEQVLPNKDLLAVGVKWQKRLRPYGTSAPALSEGQSEMVFKNQQGIWRLYQITGNSPF